MARQDLLELWGWHCADLEEAKGGCHGDSLLRQASHRNHEYLHTGATQHQSEPVPRGTILTRNVVRSWRWTPSLPECLYKTMMVHAIVYTTPAVLWVFKNAPPNNNAPHSTTNVTLVDSLWHKVNFCSVLQFVQFCPIPCRMTLLDLYRAYIWCNLFIQGGTNILDVVHPSIIHCYLWCSVSVFLVVTVWLLVSMLISMPYPDLCAS